MFNLNKEWSAFMHDEMEKQYYKDLINFCESEYALHKIYPPKEKVFNAFNLTKPDEVKVVIMGQDPYFNENQAVGLAFSVDNNIQVPPSLVNIFKEIESTMGIKNKSGNLESWAKQGVLLLNTALTVRAGQPLSHHDKGWEKFTQKVVEKLNFQYKNLIFVLWGGNAKKFEVSIDDTKQLILKAAHPSPLSAYNGFFGCNHFNKINNYLKTIGKKEIDWRTGDYQPISYENLKFDI